jgi:hypothetical protein
MMIIKGFLICLSGLLYIVPASATSTYNGCWIKIITSETKQNFQARYHFYKYLEAISSKSVPFQMYHDISRMTEEYYFDGETNTLPKESQRLSRRCYDIVLYNHNFKLSAQYQKDYETFLESYSLNHQTLLYHVVSNMSYLGDRVLKFGGYSLPTVVLEINDKRFENMSLLYCRNCPFSHPPHEPLLSPEHRENFLELKKREYRNLKFSKNRTVLKDSCDSVRNYLSLRKSYGRRKEYFCGTQKPIQQLIRARINLTETSVVEVFIALRITFDNFETIYPGNNPRRTRLLYEKDVKNYMLFCQTKPTILRFAMIEFFTRMDPAVWSFLLLVSIAFAGLKKSECTDVLLAFLRQPIPRSIANIGLPSVLCSLLCFILNNYYEASITSALAAPKQIIKVREIKELYGNTMGFKWYIPHCTNNRDFDCCYEKGQLQKSSMNYIGLNRSFLLKGLKADEIVPSKLYQMENKELSDVAVHNADSGTVLVDDDHYGKVLNSIAKAYSNVTCQIAKDDPVLSIKVVWEVYGFSCELAFGVLRDVFEGGFHQLYSSLQSYREKVQYEISKRAANSSTIISELDHLDLKPLPLNSNILVAFQVYIFFLVASLVGILGEFFLVRLKNVTNKVRAFSM